MADYRLRAVLTAQDNASKTISGVTNSVQGLAKGFVAGQLAVDAMKGAFNALKGILDTGIKFEQTQVAFETMMGSAEQGQAMLRDLYSFAAETPFEIPGVLQSARELMAMGIQSTDMINTLTMLGDIASGVGTERLGQLTLAYGQVQTATKLTGMELRQFTEAGVPLLEGLSQITGKSTSEIKRDMEKGIIIPSALVTQALNNMTKEGGKFHNLMYKQSRTLGGAFSNLKDSITIMSSKIGVLASGALGPLVNNVASFVKTNGNAIISFITAASAIGIFILAIKNATKLISVFRSILAIIPMLFTPIGIAIAMIAALLGGVVYKAMNNFMKQVGETTKAAVKGTGAMRSAAEDDLGKAAKAAEDLSRKLQDISEQIIKSERDFKESLAKIVQDTRSSIKSLESELAEETESFNNENRERLASFTQTQSKIEKEHAKKVAEIQAQIDEEVSYGWLADQERLADLRAKLAEENEDYDSQFNENKSKYEQDTLNAKTEYEKKKLELETKLNEERALLEKHSADVLSIKDIQLLDEIELLKRNHAEQLTEYAKQKEDAIRSAKETSAGMSAAYATGAEGIANSMKETFDTMGSTIGKSLANQIKWAFIDVLSNWWDDLAVGWSSLKKGVSDNGLISGIKSLFQGSKTKGWATGGIVYAANGFQPRGTDTIPAMLTPGEMVLNSNQQQKLWSMINGNAGGGVNISNINIYGNIDNKNGLSPEEIGETIGRQITLSRQGAY